MGRHPGVAGSANQRQRFEPRQGLQFQLRLYIVSHPAHRRQMRNVKGFVSLSLLACHKPPSHPIPPLSCSGAEAEGTGRNPVFKDRFVVFERAESTKT